MLLLFFFPGDIKTKPSHSKILESSQGFTKSDFFYFPVAYIITGIKCFLYL